MNSLWNIKEIVRIFKNSVKLIYNIIPRDTSFLPCLFFMMSYIYFANVNMYFDLIDIVLNMLLRFCF